MVECSEVGIADVRIGSLRCPVLERLRPFGIRRERLESCEAAPSDVSIPQEASIAALRMGEKWLFRGL
jgi:hypothetical protein